MFIYMLLLSSLFSVSLLQSNQKTEVIINISAMQDIPEKKEEIIFKQDGSDSATPFFSALYKCIDKNYGLVITPYLVAYFIAHYIGRQISLDSSHDTHKVREKMTLFFSEMVTKIHSDHHKVLEFSLSSQFDLVKTGAQEILLERDVTLDLKRLSRIKLSGSLTLWQRLYAQVCILQHTLSEFSEYLDDVKLFLDYIDDAYDDELDDFFWQDLFSYDKKLSYSHGFLLRLVPGAQLAPIASDSKKYLSGILSCTIVDGWIIPELGYKLVGK